VNLGKLGASEKGEQKGSTPKMSGSQVTGKRGGLRREETGEVPPEDAQRESFSQKGGEGARKLASLPLTTQKPSSGAVIQTDLKARKKKGLKNHRRKDSHQKAIHEGGKKETMRKRSSNKKNAKRKKNDPEKKTFKAKGGNPYKSRLCWETVPIRSQRRRGKDQSWKGKRWAKEGVH